MQNAKPPTTHDLKTAHKESLDEMLRLVDQTLDALKPTEVLSKKDAVLRRWVICLGVLMLNVGRSISRLVETEDVISIIVLCRCLYEYRIKTQFFLKGPKTRRIAFKQFMTTVTALVNALRSLPTLTTEVDSQLTRANDAWIAAGGEQDTFTAKWSVTAMALDLAAPSDVLVDRDGKYTYELRTSYILPSWFVHGSAPLITEFYERWQPHQLGLDDWSLSKTPINHDDVLPSVRRAIAHLCMYIRVVRLSYGIPFEDVMPAVERAKLLSPLNPSGLQAKAARKGSD
jgi:hypothetical protein